MNDEPVAWINREDGSSVLDWDKDPYAQEHVPLYAHPVKELTDSEITEVFDKCFPTNASSDVIPLVYFAREILRKAQEK